MRQMLIIAGLAAAALPAWPPVSCAQSATHVVSLSQALTAPDRSPASIARDAVRHPGQELAFFGLHPDATVVEIWPGGGYWTEMLAPYLAASGTYYAAIPSDPEMAHQAKPFLDKLAADPATYSRVHVTELGRGRTEIAPEGSADFVLTFRNVHNWMALGTADEMFAAFFRALKPGGILGLEEHRGLDTVAQDPKAKDGYVRQDYTVALAKKAGFELVSTSELNANPRDTKIWPQGVWTLPPSFALKDVDHAKYAAIGEADNFILKFRKPLK